MKNLTFSYILAILSLLPISGLHRFYLGKPISGLFHLLTAGFLGVGTIIDLIRMPKLVDNANLKLIIEKKRNLLLKNDYTKSHKSYEVEILNLAKENKGIITIEMVSMSSNISLKIARFELVQLSNSGYCRREIDINGTEVYIFTGFKVGKRLR